MRGTRGKLGSLWQEPNITDGMGAAIFYENQQSTTFFNSVSHVNLIILNNKI